MSAARDPLSSALGTDAPPAFKALSTREREQLATALHEARSRQGRELDEALVRALEHVPALMRGTVRRVLGL